MLVYLEEKQRSWHRYAGRADVRQSQSEKHSREELS